MTSPSSSERRADTPSGPMVVLEYAVDPSRRAAFIEFLREAFAFYESPGGIGMALYEDLDDSRRFVELAAYAGRADYDADQLRVEHDAPMRATLARFRSFLDGPLTVRRVAPVEIPRLEAPRSGAADAAVQPTSAGEWTLRDLAFNDHRAVQRLLSACGLPVPDDRDAPVSMRVATDGGQLVACAGWERYADVAMLRSVAVTSTHQRQGGGQRIVRDAIARMQSAGVRDIYLFTVNAAPFFAQIGFVEIDRALAPKDVQSCRQFAQHCCGDAVFMRLSTRSP